jgi:peptidyl-prolyl cis-trans isomerase C
MRAMRPIRASSQVAASLALAGLLVLRPGHAEPLDGGVVARLGTAAVVTSASLEARIAAMPAFQRVTFGGSAAAIARRFLEDIVVPEQLVEVAARDARLEDAPSVRLEVDRVLSGATVRAIRARVGVPASVSPDDVRAYFEAHRARYDAPARYRVSRILCKTRDEAATVLAAAKADTSPKTFADLARDHSQDKATNLRGGDLGFVTEDGTSNEPGLKVDPAVVSAARAVADGELAPQPVAEGAFFAVVWRRGTVAARKHTVDDVAPQVRDAVAKERVKDETDKLVSTLRAAHVHDENDALLDTLELPEAPSTVDAQAARGPN